METETNLVLRKPELKPPHSSHKQQRFHSSNALEILRESVRILRYNLGAFMLTAAVLICPVSALILPNFLTDQSLVNKLTVKLLLVAKSSGLPLQPLVKHACQKFAETAVSSAMCFPLFVTVSLLSRVAVVYSVDCTYSKERVEVSKFLAALRKLWRRVVFTYLWICILIVGCFTFFCVLLVAICSSFYVLGFSPDFNAYGAILVGLAFSVVFANAIIVCNTAVVVSVIEDVSGVGALVRASDLVRGQIQVGLLIFLGSTLGLAFVEGLFDHRVKRVSYGDGSSRLWEGPLLVFMYSFVTLVDSMMSAVFYFSCRVYYGMDASREETQAIMETVAVVDA